VSDEEQRDSDEVAPATEEPTDEGGNGVASSPVAPPAEEPPVDPLVAAQEEAKRLKDQLLRTLADFDNFRKRSRRDVGDAEKSGREEFLRELLPVFDNLERAVGHAETATDVQSLSDGIRMVMRQFADTLEKVGIERVPSVGTAFDPALHEAIQHLESSEHPPGTVTHEVQGGYRTGDRLIRPALVVVAKPPTDAEPSSHSGA
jgi:molecular chaperone GrpE